MDSLLVVLRVLVSLAVVVALVWYLARRFGARGGERSREAEVRVVDRHSLSRHSGVAVVAVGDRRLLVGFADQNIRLITELDAVPAESERVTEPAAEPSAVPAEPAERSSLVPSSRTRPVTSGTPAVGSAGLARRAASGVPAGTSLLGSAGVWDRVPDRVAGRASDRAALAGSSRPSAGSLPGGSAGSSRGTAAPSGYGTGHGTGSGAAYGSASGVGHGRPEDRTTSGVPGLRPLSAAATAALAGTTLPAPRRVTPAAPAAAGRRPGLLAGSVLSPATWQATVRAMQDRTVRR